MQLTPSIIADFRDGRLEGFYAEAWAPLVGYARRLLGERAAHLAEDCVQEAIFTSYERRSDIRDARQWQTYLFRLVHNAAVSLRRHYAAEQNYLMQQSDVEEDFMRSLMQEEALDTLFAAVDALPERHRRLFGLSFEQGLRNAEVAEALGVSVRAVVKQKAGLLGTLKRLLRRDER